MNFYECKYCLKKFKSKGHFDRHECEQMRRFKALGTNLGISAFDTYQKWVRVKGYRQPTKQQFVDSRTFKSFMKFSKFSQRVALPGKDEFIKLMVEMDIHPKDWSSKLVYEYYLDEFDKIFTPLQLAEMTVVSFHELARIFECKTGEVFRYLEPSTIIRMVQAKKLSPWILLCSKKFMWFMQHEMTREQRVLLQTYINTDDWGKLMRKHPDVVKEMKEMVRSLQI